MTVQHWQVEKGQHNAAKVQSLGKGQHSSLLILVLLHSGFRTRWCVLSFQMLLTRLSGRSVAELDKLMDAKVPV